MCVYMCGGCGAKRLKSGMTVAQGKWMPSVFGGKQRASWGEGGNSEGGALAEGAW